MDYETVANLTKTNPALLALRKKSTTLAIAFLYEAFKRRHEVLVPFDILLEQLDLYLENLNPALSPDEQYTQSAKSYLDRWGNDDDLIRVRSRDNDYVVQLSPHTERLMGWFEALQHRGMIGTESRLRTIITLLDEVITQSTEDVETRLNQLYDQRNKIDEEIAHIEETKQVDGLSEVQIRERLEQISNMASELLRDFSLVEERFRETARQIQQAQLDPNMKRGDIVKTALDADEKLQQSDEGQSFRAFYDILTHPQQRNQFDSLLQDVFNMPRLSSFAQDHYVLQRLTSHLLDSGERVNQSNQRLAEHLRRVVDTRNIAESRRVQMLTQDLKHQLSQLPTDDMVNLLSRARIFHTLEADPDIYLPLERPLHDPPLQIKASERPQTAPETIDIQALQVLYDVFYIDETDLKNNIKRLLMSRPQVTFAELVKSYPIAKGIAELVTYLQIAARDPRHTIDHTQKDEIDIQNRDGQMRTVLMPHIVFYREPMKSNKEITA